MNITFEWLRVEELPQIKPLWECLNEIHLHDSLYFKEHFQNNTFEKRFHDIKEITPENLHLEVIKDTGQIIGYCVSSVQNGTGEIESLFIEEKYRKCGFGKRLVQNALEWFTAKNCQKFIVGVAGGHEKVFGFYQKMGFFPRTTVLELKNKPIDKVQSHDHI